jgi:hypothetical protein
VRRESPVPDRDGGSGRWSIDHLFLDQAGVPTLVEVKRSSDSRIRREVVGQMLDYAANGVRYWDAAELRVVFEGTCASMTKDPGAQLEAVIGADADVEEFWREIRDPLRGWQAAWHPRLRASASTCLGNLELSPPKQLRGDSAFAGLRRIRRLRARRFD